MGTEDWEATMAKGGGRRGAEVNEGEGGQWRRGKEKRHRWRRARSGGWRWRRGRGRRSATVALDLGDGNDGEPTKERTIEKRGGDGEPTKERTKEKRGGSDILVVGEGEEAGMARSGGWMVERKREEICNGSAGSWGWRRWRADEGKNQREERRRWRANEGKNQREERQQRHPRWRGRGGGRQEAAAGQWRRGRGRRFATTTLDLWDGGDGEPTKERIRKKSGSDGKSTKERTRENRGSGDILVGEGEEADGKEVHGVDGEG